MSISQNAIDSIQVGVLDYKSGDARRHLSSVRNITSGIILLYKEKLCRMSPPHDKELLIKKDIRPTYDKAGNVIFIGKGPRTVDVQQIKERFSSLNIKIDCTRLDKVILLRNEIEHYYTKKSPNTVRELVAKSFILIRDFLVKHLKEDPATFLGTDCWNTLLDISEVYQAEEVSCRESLKGIDWKYTTVKNALEDIRCPQCSSNLIKTEKKGDFDISIELLCSSCGHSFIIESVLEECIAGSLAGQVYRSMKDGEDPPYDICPECFKATYIFEESCCIACSYEQEYSVCTLCSSDLPLEDQDLAGFCSYCNYKISDL